MVDDYINGRSERSRAVSCCDAEFNISLQAHAKMAECAFTLWTGLDPDHDVCWNHCDGDGGSDVFWDGLRWDVKAAEMHKQFLIWSIAKNHLYASRNFDALVFVKHDVPNFEIVGWISKEAFFHRHEVAGERHKLFRGTWYMHEKDLWSMDIFSRTKYDTSKDLAGSIEDGFRAIRERQANGGPGWEPK